MKIIDTHTHLDHLENIEQALENAAQSGVEHIITVGVDLASNKKNLELQKNTQQPKIHVALGMHPGYYKLDEIDACIDFIRGHKDECIAIGEIGLDFWYKEVRKDKEKHQQQRELFERQLDLAKEFDLPVIVHSRGTWRECFEKVKDRGFKKANFHWYSGPIDVLDDIMEAGYFVSTAPSVAYSPQSREAMSHACIEQTLIETDCPVRFREGEEQFVSEPKDVVRTLKAYAELKNIEQEKALEILNKNAKEFFNL